MKVEELKATIAYNRAFGRETVLKLLAVVEAAKALRAGWPKTRPAGPLKALYDAIHDLEADHG